MRSEVFRILSKVRGGLLIFPIIAWAHQLPTKPVVNNDIWSDRVKYRSENKLCFLKGEV